MLKPKKIINLILYLRYSLRGEELDDLAEESIKSDFTRALSLTRGILHAKLRSKPAIKPLTARVVYLLYNMYLDDLLFLPITLFCFYAH